MSSQAKPSSFGYADRRRSERLPFKETLFVCGRCEGRPFKEETLTVSVSAIGTLVALSAKVSLGQKVLLMNPQTWDEREGYVSRLGEVHNERRQVAIEFAKAAPEFWPIRAPFNPLRVNASDLEERVALRDASPSCAD
jgi:hypothetical protein